MAKLKESKSSPWAKLAAAAKTADAPAGKATWNSRKARKDGDVIMGTVEDIVDTMTGFGKGRVLHLRTPEGKTEGLFLSSVLQNQIDAAGGFNKGDAVFVKYLGVPKGKRYALYTVGKA